MSRSAFRVPPNVLLIGTMNTADRSIALLDTALRRRFGFVELMPDASLLEGATVAGIPLGPWLDALNRRICEHVGRDARNLQVGHSFLLEGGQPVKDAVRFFRVVRDEIIPLLEEYCYEDFDALHSILGSGLVDLPEPGHPPRPVRGADGAGTRAGAPGTLPGHRDLDPCRDDRRARRGRGRDGRG